MSSSRKQPGGKRSRPAVRASRAVPKRTQKGRAPASKGAVRRPAPKAATKSPAKAAPRKKAAGRPRAATTARPAARRKPATTRGTGPVRSTKAPPPAVAPAAPPAPPSAARRSIRLAGSASSRLTIKPGPPHGPTARLDLSTKQRPPGPRPLSEVELDEDEVLIDVFDADLAGVRVRITAVLERTCVYIDVGGERRLASKKDLVVEADKLPIRRRGIG